MALRKQIVLITGANSGIGYALAALLIEDSSKHVLLGSRSVSKGETALNELRSLNLPGSAELLKLDVTSTDSVATAVKNVEAKHGRLDALVNNAATGTFPSETTLAEKLRNSFETNVIGVQMVTEAFEPLMKKSTSTARIINVSSGGGSITFRMDPKVNAMLKRFGPMVQYQVSKAALNMLSACQAMEYGEQGWKVFTYAPGHTVSNLGPHNKAEYGAKPTVDGARPMVGMLNGDRDAEHGCFLDSQGGQHPW